MNRRGIGVLAGVLLLSALFLPLAAAALSRVLAPRFWLRRARWREEQAVRPMLSDIACGAQFEGVTTPAGRHVRVLTRALGAGRCLAIALGGGREGALIAEVPAARDRLRERIGELWDAADARAVEWSASERKLLAGGAAAAVAAFENSGIPPSLAALVARELEP